VQRPFWHFSRQSSKLTADNDDDAQICRERPSHQSQSNWWVLRCRANARGDSVAVQRAAGRLLHLRGEKYLLLHSVVIMGQRGTADEL